MKKKTLVIYGSLGAGELGHHVKDWSNAQVVEMDAILPAEILQQGPGVVPSAPVMDHARAADIQRRVNALIGELLQERAGTPGLETGREFRAACISIECFMMLSPYLYNLDIARRLASAGPWDKIVVSPAAESACLPGVRWPSTAECRCTSCQTKAAVRPSGGC